MEELIKLLETLTAYVGSLHITYERLVEIMNIEEDLISRYEMKDFQNVVAEKHQTVQRAQKTEEKRVATLRRICFLISFDARHTLPNIAEFNSAFRAYLQNIETLVNNETLEQVKAQFDKYRETANALHTQFKEVIAPRIHQNRIIIEKVHSNFKKSMRIFESAGGVAHSYDKNGHANSNVTRTENTSMLRVQV